MINLRLVLRQVGLLLLVISAALLAVTLATSQWLGFGVDDLRTTRSMLQAVCVGMAGGLVLWLFGRQCRSFIGHREALLLVALSWLVGAVVAALPYFFWAGGGSNTHPFASFVGCYFEAMSGLSTTGATVLAEVESLPRGLLLWRAVTQWLGGLGIVVLFVAVLPSLGVGGKKLFQVEATGPTSQGVRPRVRETARLLWLIYLGFTCVEMAVLCFFGMPVFDAACHTFSTVASGGFSSQNAGIGGYDSVAITGTIILFMLLAGINFGIYYQLLRGRWNMLWRDPEFRCYGGILLLGSIIVVWQLYGGRIVLTSGKLIESAGFADALVHGVFQVVSLHTGTGFCTADFDQWGVVPKALLVGLMFVGGSAGSTSGGIKVIRCLVAAKVIIAEIERVFRPAVVRTIKAGRWAVDPELRQATVVYLLIIVLISVAATVILMFLQPQLDITTAAMASIATLNNIGPGLAGVGAMSNYGWFEPASQLVMCVLMVMGRLEIYAILVLFLPGFWRSE